MKNIFRKLSSVIMVLVMAMMILPTSAFAASTPKLSKTSAEVSIGYYITLNVSGASGTVKWSSGDSSIATVKSTGSNSAKVTGKKTGSTYIYAKTGSKTLKCKVTVKKSFISASKSTVDLTAGRSGTVTLTVKGDKNIAVNNSDKSIVTTSWGKWNDNTIKLTIKAQKAGTAKLKIYTKGYSSSTAKTITVKVSDSGTVSESAENTSYSTSDMADDVITIMNKERAAVGASALAKDPTLTQIAELRANELISSFSHTRPNGTECFTAYDEAGYKYTAAGENIANGQQSAEAVMKSWMNSAGHKANILNSSYGHVGVGCVQSGGKYYWVQVFSN